MTRVYVGNIEKRTTKEELLEFLKPMKDEIEDSWLARRPPGFAFITVKPSQVGRFVQTFNGKEFHGRRLVVEASTSSTVPKGRGYRRRERSDSRQFSSRDRRRSTSRARRSHDRWHDRDHARHRDRSADRKRYRRSYSRSRSRSSRSSR
ncbi:RNA-binding protein [Trypanosoma vivax]|nr:RNA-binding protein [Trypanosoma vivax]